MPKIIMDRQFLEQLPMFAYLQKIIFMLQMLVIAEGLEFSEETLTKQNLKF